MVLRCLCANGAAATQYSDRYQFYLFWICRNLPQEMTEGSKGSSGRKKAVHSCICYPAYYLSISRPIEGLGDNAGTTRPDFYFTTYGVVLQQE